VRIVRLANFVAPRSGGLRTALRELGAGYLAAGHEPVLIVPGDCDHDAQTPQGRVITLRGPLVPLSGGYRLLLSRRRVTALLNALSWPSEKRRAAARARAEEFGWEASVGGFLAAHGVSEAVPA
jgi:hypothetical protein